MRSGRMKSLMAAPFLEKLSGLLITYGSPLTCRAGTVDPVSASNSGSPAYWGGRLANPTGSGLFHSLPPPAATPSHSAETSAEAIVEAGRTYRRIKYDLRQPLECFHATCVVKVSLRHCMLVASISVMPGS